VHESGGGSYHRENGQAHQLNQVLHVLQLNMLSASDTTAAMPTTRKATAITSYSNHLTMGAPL
jgi:hypothetical protein